MVMCVLHCMQRLLDVFNGLAFVFVALDGDTFCGASGKALQLMRDHGVLASLLDEVLLPDCNATQPNCKYLKSESRRTERTV